MEGTVFDLTNEELYSLNKHSRFVRSAWRENLIQRTIPVGTCVNLKINGNRIGTAKLVARHKEKYTGKTMLIFEKSGEGCEEALEGITKREDLTKASKKPVKKTEAA